MLLAHAHSNSTKLRLASPLATTLCHSAMKPGFILWQRCPASASLKVLLVPALHLDPGHRCRTPLPLGFHRGHLSLRGSYSGFRRIQSESTGIPTVAGLMQTQPLSAVFGAIFPLAANCEVWYNENPAEETRADSTSAPGQRNTMQFKNKFVVIARSEGGES